MISSISSFEIITVVQCIKSEYCLTNLRIVFLCSTASADYAASVNSNDIKTPLADVLSKCFIKGKIFFSNRLKILPRNTTDGTILNS